MDAPLDGIQQQQLQTRAAPVLDIATEELPPGTPPTQPLLRRPGRWRFAIAALAVSIAIVGVFGGVLLLQKRPVTAVAASQALSATSLQELSSISKLQGSSDTYTIGGDLIITGNITAANFKGVNSLPAQGQVAVTGPAGPQGLPGVAGGTGVAGALGVAGAMGVTGATGTVGPSGTASCPYGNCLSLQPTSPGTAETGNLSITGTGLFSTSLGIGTTSPNAALEVAGAVSIFGAGEGGTPVASTLRGAAAAGTDIQGASLTVDASNGTGAGGSGDLIFRTAAPPSRPAFDAASAENSGAFAHPSQTFNHTVSTDTNRLLLVVVNEMQYASVSPAGVTYGGQALTKLDEQLSPGVNFPGGDIRTELWYLLSPPSGTHQVNVDFTIATLYSISAVSYTGVDQVRPFGTIAKTSGSVGGGLHPISLSVAGNPTQLVFYGLGANNGGGVATGTQRVFDLGNSFLHSGAQDTPGVTPQVTEGWSLDSADWAMIGVPLNQPTGSSPDVLVDRLHIASNGDVGIGTSTPTALLHVVGPRQTVSGLDANTALIVTGGLGGSAGAGQTGGLGAGITLAAGAGGAATDPAGIPGTGGRTVLSGGAGGTGFGVGSNGNGGDVSIQGGVAGIGGSGAVGKVGDVRLQAAGGNVEIGALTLPDGSARFAIGTGAATAKGLVIQNVPGQTADLIQAQDSTGAVLARLTSDGSLEVVNAVVNGTLTVNGHLITGGAAPVAAVGAGAGTGAVASVTGNDTSGQITLTTGTNPVTGALVDLTFATAFATAPRITLTPSNAASSTIQYFASTSPTAATLSTNSPPVTATTYTYFYHVEQ